MLPHAGIRATIPSYLMLLNLQSFLEDIFIIICLCMHVHMSVFVCEVRGIHPLGAGVIGNYELLDMGAEN